MKMYNVLKPKPQNTEGILMNHYRSYLEIFLLQHLLRSMLYLSYLQRQELQHPVRQLSNFLPVKEKNDYHLQSYTGFFFLQVNHLK